jgi:hypothetical protein
MDRPDVIVVEGGQGDDVQHDGGGCSDAEF